MNSNICIVSAHYNEDVDWLIKQEKYPYCIYTKTMKDISPEKGKYITTNVGAEAESYLRYIVDNYNNLPDVMVFIHGHETSWHNKGTILQVLEEMGDLQAYTYKSLNNSCWNLHLMSSNITSDDIEKHKAYKNMAYKVGSYVYLHTHHQIVEKYLDQFKYLHNLSPDEVAKISFTMSRSSAQFVVNSEMIKRLPHEYWKELLYRMYILGSKDDGKSVAYLFEHSWFWIITGHHDEVAYMFENRHLRKKTD